MQRKHDVRARQTLETLSQVLEQGVSKCSLIIRHSERFFTDEARMEPFMGLTPNGKNYAQELGEALASYPDLKLCCSFFGRCIETAYLIDKGHTRAHGGSLDHPVVESTLAPFYIKDIETAIPLVEEQGSELFLRNWFDHRLDEGVMEDPEASADRICDFMISQAAALPDNGVCICVSHDWNIFPVKEFKMGLSHETSGDVGYLDGLIFYEKDGQKYIVNYQSDPIKL